MLHQRIGRGALTQLWFAQGRIRAADSVTRAGAVDRIRPVVNRYFVSALLAGVGDPVAAKRAVAELAAFAPADSLEAYVDEKPQVWAAAWAVAAYHAAFGDSAEARAWQAAIAALSPGDTPWDWRGALVADIEARLAVRRGDLAAAEGQAQRAYDLWIIHPASFVLEADPEPAMRFHLAEVLHSVGSVEHAERLYRSLSPPHTWLGFYTARASFELGQIDEARGNRDEAARHYLRALRLWEHGEPHVVGSWLAKVQEGLRRLSPG